MKDLLGMGMEGGIRRSELSKETNYMVLKVGGITFRCMGTVHGIERR